MAKDISYCFRECHNYKCERNKSSLIPGDIVSMMNFDDCENYIDIYDGIDLETGKRFDDLTDEEFSECFGVLKCSQCEKRANCHRLEKLEWASPWFSTSRDGPICKDFYPKKYLVLLRKYWRGVEPFILDIDPESLVAFCINHDQSVRYYIKYLYFNNDIMWNGDKLRWVYRQYYKHTKDSPFGYKLIKEINEDD